MLSIPLGPIALPVSQALLLAGLVAALSAGAVAGRLRGAVVSDTLISMLLLGLLSARMVFVLRYAGTYAADPLTVLDIRDGGYDWLGGLVGAAVFGAISLWRRPELRMPLPVAVAAGVIGWGAAALLLRFAAPAVDDLPQQALARYDGPPTSLAALQSAAGGPPMVVNLWASWCPPCRHEMKVLRQAQRTRSDTLFVFVNQGESRADVKTFFDSQSLTLDNVLLDSRGVVSGAVGSSVLPTTLFYGSNGQLLDSHVGLLSEATLMHRLKTLAGPDRPR